jgi:PAS domain S-box-containing protein
MNTSLNEHGLRAIIEDSADLLIRVSEDGTINYTNLASLKLLGLTKEDIIGKNIWGTTENRNKAGGKLSIQSTPGVGTAIEISLPRAISKAQN